VISAALLILRVVVGGLLAGHGAQKLFGSFGGGGVKGTGVYMHSLGLRPGVQMATLAGAAEFAGGALTVVGLLNPLGPILTSTVMVVATISQHRGRPIWVSEGGAELPVINVAAMSAIAIAGPGKVSMDALLGTSLPRWWIVPGAAAIGAVAAYMDAVRERSLNPDDDEIDDEPDDSDESDASEGATRTTPRRRTRGSSRTRAAASP
jgi:putative oxidoreductase